MNALFTFLSPAFRDLRLGRGGKIRLVAMRPWLTIPSVRSFLSLGLCGLLFLTTGCSAKAKMERHTERGDTAFAKADYETARLEYMNALQLAPDNAHIIRQLGFIFLETGNVVSAGQFLNKAKELEPNNLEVRAKLATIFTAVGLSSNAVQEAEFILQRSPGQGDALLTLAGAAQNTNQVAATLKRLEAMLPAQKTNLTLYLALGQLHQKSRDPKAAEEAYKTAQSLSPTNSKPALALANLYAMQGQTNAAEALFQTAVKLAPVKSPETLMYADFKLKTGQIEAGRKILEEATEKAPDFAPALNALAKLALAQQRTNDCAVLIKKVLARDANNRDALLTQARLKIAQRDLKSAVEDLEKLATNARDSEVLYQLAQLQRAENNPTKALATLDRSIAANTNFVEGLLLRAEIQLDRGGNPATIIPDLARLAQRYPQVSQAQYLLASAYLRRGTPADALEVYSRIAQTFPKDPKAPHLAGVTLRKARRPADARAAFEAALKIEPDFLLPLDELIELDIEQKDYPSAMKRIQQYIDKYPDKPVPRLLQAKVFIAESKNAEALASLEKALELDPEFSPAHRAISQLYISSGQNDAAIAKLEQMLVKNPRDVGARLQRAMLAEASKDYKASRENYEKLLEVNPNSVPALNNLAYLLSEHFNDLERAASLSEKAQKLAPYDPYIADTFGWITYRRGDYQQALSLLQQSAKELSTQPEVQFHLGMAYYMTGAEQAARTALQFAVASTNDFPGKAIAKDSLAILDTNPNAAAPGDVQRLEKAVERNPGDLLAWYRLGQVYEVQRSFEKALATYQSALKVNPRSAAILVRVAVLQIENLNQPAKGLETARLARTISQDSQVAGTLGRLGSLAGDPKWALPLLEQASRANQTDPALAYHLALSYYTQARLDQAEQSLVRARAASSVFPEQRFLPSFAQLLAYHRGSATAAEAQTAATALLAAAPEHPAGQLVTAMLQETRNPASARQQYEQLVKKSPDFLLAQRQFALFLAEGAMDDAAATPLLARLRVILPNDAALGKAQGSVAYRRQDYREAARVLGQVASQYPKDADVHYFLGMSQFHTKERAAKQTLTTALSLKPDGPLAVDAKKALAELK